MSYVHPLFDSKIEEVSPPQLARALGFEVFECGDYPDDVYMETLHACDLDHFYFVWEPSVPDGFVLGGKYESEEGP